MSDEQKPERELQLLIDDSKGAFSTLDRFESETIQRTARRWNIHVPEAWAKKEVLPYRERVILTRMTQQAMSRWSNRFIWPALLVFGAVTWWFDGEPFWMIVEFLADVSFGTFW